jgi:hypothetical protein
MQNGFFGNLSNLDLGIQEVLERCLTAHVPGMNDLDTSFTQAHSDLAMMGTDNTDKATYMWENYQSIYNEHKIFKKIMKERPPSIFSKSPMMCKKTSI